MVRWRPGIEFGPECQAEASLQWLTKKQLIDKRPNKE
jgi:hypothetical protein